MINKLFIIILFSCVTLKAQNPMEHWGVLHNKYLEPLLTTENLQTNSLESLENLGNQFFTSQKWNLIDNDIHYQTHIHNICKSLQLNETSQNSILNILISDENLDDENFYLLLLNEEIKLLAYPEQNKIALGFIAVARYSFNFWINYDKNPLKKDKKKVPFRVIIKYDAFGFLTGLIFGGVVYGGYELFISKSRYDSTGIFIGAGITLVTTVWNSFRWARKYKNKTSESDS